MNDLISRSELLKAFNNKKVQITFDLPVEEVLGEDVDLDDFMKIINEEWKTIERTNGNYEISNLGRVKSKERIYLSGENYRIKKKTGGKLLNPTISKDGYPTVSLRLDDGKRHTLKVHRLVALAFIQNPKNLPQINHKDENK